MMHRTTGDNMNAFPDLLILYKYLRYESPTYVRRVVILSHQYTLYSWTFFILLFSIIPSATARSLLSHSSTTFHHSSSPVSRSIATTLSSSTSANALNHLRSFSDSSESGSAAKSGRCNTQVLSFSNFLNTFPYTDAYSKTAGKMTCVLQSTRSARCVRPLHLSGAIAHFSGP
ncbi:hypothetical protein BDQ17DRAFT_1071707 [Cyathus striatus]|nr:hypothetical protein BDQ17DRAFT_1071707 [Cyathus striatus]